MHAIVLFWGLILLQGSVLSNPLDRQRSDFLMAERLIAERNDQALLNLSAGLQDYPLYPYLEFQWLENNLHRTDKVLAFLSAYKETRYAGLLKPKWLAFLANHERWLEFIQNYEAIGNSALECQFYWAIYQTGNKQQALNNAKRLWVSDISQPKECDSLFSVLVTSSIFTPDLIWQRFELALNKDRLAVTEYLRRLMNKRDQNFADIWLQVHRNPALISNSGFVIRNDHQTGRIFAHGIDRLAGSNLDLAIYLWDKSKGYFSIDQQTLQQLERRLALAMGFNKNKNAYNRLNQLVTVDEEVREWKVRAALLEQNWQHVSDALTGLKFEEREEPRWQYWLARSLNETGKILQAQTVYNKLAADRSFYGFLAADTINRPYQSLNKPVLVAKDELEALAGNSDFKEVQEFRWLNREREAQQQWWFAVKKLPKARLMAAAKLAQQWRWDQVAIITLVKADYWDDLALRFPLNYLIQVQNNAYRQDLEPAIIFGLIRQESMLDENAQSPVGAKGLMQLMPKTGKQIARELNEQWQSENSLFNPDINIKYGSYYYKQLLDRFNGHFALATAAYNAGPRRVINWMPIDKSVPADIWVETIPFKETRKYVTSVLSYAMIYQQRLQRNTFKIKNLMLDVLPR
ncbi:Soluble lytic murein transglycosylase [Candidatus Methylobacter favarea]|uniref:Soluble lytic murein transglycosylase n=1 Tax=Candidatus Methylobacter favarea TaxID=2707345 RepID=A0A8S0W981_9GAMM|nr:lytic transglycosylase domain-containing protein [Candidatus Methylobacter favarea]CAA9889784.1 Soluble lytic murein transglycosylase [Candidatus Methylobacter favarea]